MVKNKSMKILFIISLLQLVASCKEKGTEPPPTKPLKNPRDMNWSADTLKMPDYAIQMLPQDLVVISPEDIWLAVWVGHGQVMHYDSSKGWQMVKEVGGGIDCLVEGETKNRIWVGGYIGREVQGQFTQNAYIGFYNGTNWQDTEFNIRSEILDQTKDVNGNIWACGRNGLVMKYENNKWISDTVNMLSNYPLSLSLRSNEFYKDKISLLSETYDSNNRKYYYYYFSGTIDNWSLVDSMILENPSSEIRFGNFGLHKGDNSELYSFGLEGIWKRMNNIWEKIFDIDGEVYCMYVVNRDYIMAGSAYKKIFFYNGSRWENINDLFEIDDPEFVFKCIWTDGNELFVVGYGNINGLQQTIIWHGK